MATPTGNVKVYPNIQHVTTSSEGGASSFLRDFMAFLLNDQTAFGSSAWVPANGGTGGPGWEIIESYSGAAATRQTPLTTTGNGALLSHTPGTNGWRPDVATLTVGDWIVLETKDPYKFQIYFELQSTTVLYYKMMPYGNFATGGSAITPPTGSFPSTGVPGYGADTFMQQTVFDAPAKYRAVAADRFFAMIADPGDFTSVTFEYMGEVAGAVSLDTRPYVAYEATNNCRWDLITASQWNRISPVDGATELILGSNVQMINVPDLGYRVHRYWDGGTTTSGTRMLPVGVFFDDANHNHFAGWLVGVCSSNTDQGAVGAVNNATRGDDTGDGVGPNSGGQHNYAFRYDYTTGTPAGIAFYWDGQTEVP